MTDTEACAARPSLVPSISVVVPAHRADANLAACLRSIALLDPPPLERILACDGPLRGLAGLAGETGFRVLHGAGRGGPARTRNQGARAAAGEVLLFLDSDVTTPPDLVGRVAEAFRQRPELAALIGSYDDAPADPGAVSQYRNLLHHYVHQSSREAASTFWAGCGAVRRSELEKLGGFDESYGRASIEDIELGYRIRRSGGAIRLAKDVRVKHLKRWTLASFLWTDLVRRSVPWTRLILREGRMLDDLNLSTRHRLSAAASLGVLVTSMLSARDASWLWAAAALLAAFLGLNREFLAFLGARRGPTACLAAVPLHLLHYLVAGLGFGLGVAGWAVEALGPGAAAGGSAGSGSRR